MDVSIPTPSPPASSATFRDTACAPVAARLNSNFIPVLVGIVIGYALLVELMKALFFRRAPGVGGSGANSHA
jgi:hypothetical protein